jgi:tetratricopeptide (TPR) repeat protein
MSCYTDSNSIQIDEEISKGVELLLEGHFLESYSHFTNTLEAACTQDDKKIVDRYCNIADLCILRSNMEIGDYQAKLGRYELALEIYSELDIKASRDVPTMLQYQWKINSGTCLARLSRKEEAMTIYMQSLNINPNSVKTLNNIAILLAEMGRYEESISAFEKSLRLSPEDYNALCGMAGCFRMLHQFTKSEELVAKSILVSKKLHKLESHDLLSAHTPSPRSLRAASLNENMRRGLATETNFSSSSSSRGEENNEPKYQSSKKDSDQIVPQPSQREGLRTNLGKKLTPSSNVMASENKGVTNDQYRYRMEKERKVISATNSPRISASSSSPLSNEPSSQFVISPLSVSMVMHKIDQVKNRNSCSTSNNPPKKDLLSKIMGKSGRKIKTSEDHKNHEKSFHSASSSQNSVNPNLSAFSRTSTSHLQWPTPLNNTTAPNPNIRSSLSIPCTSTPSIGTRRSLPFQSPSNVHFSHSPTSDQVSTYTPSKASLAPKSPFCSEKFYSNQVGDIILSSPSPLPRLAQSNTRWKSNATNESTILNNSVSDDSKGFARLWTTNDTNPANLSLSLPDRETIKPSKKSLEKIRQIAIRQIIHHDRRYLSGNISDTSSVSSSSTCINHGTSTDDTESVESWSGKPMRYNKPSKRGDRNDMGTSPTPFYPKNISLLENTTDILNSNRHRKNKERGTVIKASLDLSSPNIGSQNVFSQSHLDLTPLGMVESQNRAVERYSSQDHTSCPVDITDEEFVKFFGMTREQWRLLPRWQQVRINTRLL